MSRHAESASAPSIALLFLFLAGCTTPPPPFSLADARTHLNVLAGSIGSRPVGSQQNADARAYLVGRLRAYGFAVETLEAESRRDDLGVTANVVNIVATRAGNKPDAIALVAHYDSVPDGPGAADDGFGSAVVLEAARTLTQNGNRRHTLIVLLTDGEEAGLLGAASAVKGEVFHTRARAYVNVEAIGSDGPLLLFETGPGNAGLISAWARSFAPRGASYAREIYRYLPRDTDFSMLKRSGVPGLNLALVGDGYAYHTDRDVPERISDRTLTTAGATVVRLVETLDKMDLGTRTDNDVTYFDVAGLFGVWYGARWSYAISIGALVLGAFAWWRVFRRLMASGPRALMVAMGSSIIVSTAVVGAMLGAAWLLRATREVYHPWYAHPDRFFFLLATSAAVGGWFAAQGLSYLPWRRASHPAGLWCFALPVWMALAGLSVWFAEGAAFVWTIPLLTAAIGLIVAPIDRPPVPRLVAFTVLAVVALFWTRDALLLARFTVTTLGLEPVITPIWIYPALLAMTGAMLVPPALSAFRCHCQRTTRTAVTAGLLIALAGSFAAAYRASAYTPDRPQRRSLRYLYDVGRGIALWELDGNESGPSVSEAGPARWYNAPRDWRAERRAPARVRLEQEIRRRRGIPEDPEAQAKRNTARPRSTRPFRYRATAPIETAPATVDAHVDMIGDELELFVTVRPTEPETTVSLVLPVAVRPRRSSVPGVVLLSEKWSAAYIPSPGGSATFRVALHSNDILRLDATRILVSRTRLPATAPGARLPTWVPTERATWTTRADFLLRLPLPNS